MSKAYKCDKCGKLFENEPAGIYEDRSGMDVGIEQDEWQLCFDCVNETNNFLMNDIDSDDLNNVIEQMEKDIRNNFLGGNPCDVCLHFVDRKCTQLGCTWEWQGKKGL